MQLKQVALHRAAGAGHIHACKTLLNFGANAHAKDIVSIRVLT